MIIVSKQLHLKVSLEFFYSGSLIQQIIRVGRKNNFSKLKKSSFGTECQLKQLVNISQKSRIRRRRRRRRRGTVSQAAKWRGRRSVSPRADDQQQKSGTWVLANPSRSLSYELLRRRSLWNSSLHTHTYTYYEGAIMLLKHVR